VINYDLLNVKNLLLDVLLQTLTNEFASAATELVDKYCNSDEQTHPDFSSDQVSLFHEH